MTELFALGLIVAGLVLGLVIGFLTGHNSGIRWMESHGWRSWI